MGQRYRQGYDENGNAIDPAFWIENHNVLAGEFNGGLDRDNFGSADVAATEPVTGTFCNRRTNNTDTSYSPDMTTTDWQGGGGNDASGIAQVSWTSEQDAHYDIHWSGGWSWNGSYSLIDAGYIGTGASPNRLDNTSVVDTIEIRLLVDGILVAVAGPFDDGLQYGATSMVGAIQLPAGRHTLKVECMLARRVWQDGQIDDVCTNDCTITSRNLVVLERDR